MACTEWVCYRVLRRRYPSRLTLPTTRKPAMYYTDEQDANYYLMGYEDCHGGAGYNAKHEKNKEYNRGWDDAARC
jgi:hypothetical protein